MLYGDADTIRGLARRLDEQALEICDEADRLVALAQSCVWSGWAADAMRRRNGERAVALRRSAVRHQDAAQALARHAEAVDRVQELIVAAERKARSVLDDLGELAGRWVPPPPGHRDWLDLDLTALRG